MSHIDKKRCSIRQSIIPTRSKPIYLDLGSGKLIRNTLSPSKLTLASIYSPRCQDVKVCGKSSLKPIKAFRFVPREKEVLPAIRTPISTMTNSNYSSCERSPVNLRYQRCKVRKFSKLLSRVDSTNVMQTPTLPDEDDSYLNNTFAHTLKTYYEEEIDSYGSKQLNSPIPRRQFLSETHAHFKPNRCDSPISKKLLPSIFNLDQVPMKLHMP